MRTRSFDHQRTGRLVACSVAALMLLSPDVASAQPKALQHSVQVVATDYAFTAPDTVAPGPTAFHLANRGTKRHEIAIVLARRGTTAAQIVAAAKAGLPAPMLADAYSDGSPMGALFVAPGGRSRASLVASLERGQLYVIVCTLRDAPTMPQHAALGMFHLIHVR